MNNGIVFPGMAILYLTFFYFILQAASKHLFQCFARAKHADKRRSHLILT